MTTKRGISAVVTTQRTAGITVAADAVNATITDITSTGATLLAEQDVTHDFRVPAHTRMNGDYGAIVKTCG